MQTIVDSNKPLFSNSFITCYSDYFIIHLYYFPIGNKKIQYKNIRSCEFHSTDNLDLFNCKHWGMALSPIWWHCDIKRFSRKHYILIEANQWPKIGLTMDENHIAHVYNLIRQKMFSNQSNDSIEKVPHHFPQTAMSEKELEHQKSLLQNKSKF